MFGLCRAADFSLAFWERSASTIEDDSIIRYVQILLAARINIIESEPTSPTNRKSS
jgi:hypothetical protein